jgi:hypothetical protein
MKIDFKIYEPIQEIPLTEYEREWFLFALTFEKKQTKIKEIKEKIKELIPFGKCFYLNDYKYRKLQEQYGENEVWYCVLQLIAEGEIYTKHYEIGYTAFIRIDVWQDFHRRWHFYH